MSTRIEAHDAPVRLKLTPISRGSHIVVGDADLTQYTRALELRASVDAVTTLDLECLVGDEAEVDALAGRLNLEIKTHRDLLMEDALRAIIRASRAADLDMLRREIGRAETLLTRSEG